MATEGPFQRLTLNPADVEAVVSDNRETGIDPTYVIANALTSQFPDDPDLSYLSLTSGNSKYLQDSGRGDLGFTDEEVIQFLATNEDGSPIDTGFSRAVTGGAREVIPSASAIPAMTAGLKAGVALQNLIPIPPYPGVAQAALAARVATPLITSLTAGIFGYEAVKAAQNWMLGDEDVVLPTDTSSVNAAKTLVGVGIPVSGLRVVTQGIQRDLKGDFNLGGGQFIKNIRQREKEILDAKEALANAGPASLIRPKRPFEPNRINPLGQSPAQVAAASIKNPTKNPRMARFNNFVEKQLKEAPDQPLDAIAKYQIASGSVGASAASYFAEESDPGDGKTRFFAELGGSTLGSFAPNLLRALKNNNNVFSEILGKIKGTDESNRSAVMKGILDDLRSSTDPNDDPEKILRLMQENEFKLILEELEANTSDLPHLNNVVLRSGSPVLRGWQLSLDRVANDNIDAKNKLQSQAFFDTYRENIIQLARTGDPDAIQFAADLMQANYASGMEEQLAKASAAKIAAFQKIQSAGGSSTETSGQLQEVTETLMRQARALESQMWNSTKNSELSVQELVDSGALQSGSLENPSAVDLLNKFLEPFENSRPGVKEQSQQKLENLVKYAQDLRDRLTVKTPNVLDDMPASIAKKYDEIQSLGVVTRINPETNRVELAPTDLMGATQTNAQEEAARKKFNDVQEYFNDFDDTPSLGDPDDTISTKELIAARGEWLSLMRSLNGGASPDKNKARIAGEFSELLLDVVETLPFDQETKAGQTLARAYSSAFNDVFTRSFTGKGTLKTGTGERRKPPELLHKELFSGGADALSVRLADFDNMFDFLKKEGIDTTQTMSDGTIIDTVTDSRDLMNRLLANYAFGKFSNQAEGEITQSTLDNFRVQFKDILSRPEFQQVDEALKDVDSAKKLYNTTMSQQGAEEKRLKGLVSFKQLTSDATESPSTTINSAIGGSNKKPMESLKNLLEVVENKDLSPEQQQEAKDGLRYAVLDWAIDKAGANTYTEGNKVAFKPSKMFQYLFAPIPNAKGKQSLLTVTGIPNKDVTAPLKFKYGGWLVDNGLMDADQAERIHKSLIKMVGFETEIEAGNVSSLVSEAGAMMDLYLTMVGSAGATATAANLGLRGGAGAIAIPARGAQLLRNWYSKLNITDRPRVLAEMLENPDLFSAHLKKALTEEDAENIISSISKQFSAKLGITLPRTSASVLVSDPEDVVSDDVGRREPQPQAQPVPEPVPVPQAQPVTQLQQPVPPPTMAPAPVAPPTAPSGPVDRSQYAALFPNDMASGLIRASNQGIGSLMT